MSSERDTDCNEIENSPKRRRVLRERKEFVGCSYRLDIDSDSYEDLDDFQCSGELTDQTWKPSESDYEFNEDSTSANFNKPGVIDDEIVRCGQPSQITLCSVSTESNAVAELTVNERNTEDPNATNSAITAEQAIINQPKGI